MVKADSFSSQITNKTKVHLSPFLINIIPELLARVIRQEIKGIRIVNKKIKLSSFA